MTNYGVRLAQASDIPDLMSLRAEAEQWLAAAGIDQWSDPDLGERAMQSWLEKIQLGRTWVFTADGNRVVATVSRGDADQDFWTADDDIHSAFYIYKLIVARSESGSHLGARILDWASAIAAAEGRSWLRLDVWRSNRRLQQYYEKWGFDHVRTESPRHRLSGWLGQRPAGSLLLPDAMLPLIPKPLPAGFAERLANAQARARELSDEVAELLADLEATSTPVTGKVRGAYDRAHEHLSIARGTVRTSLERLRSTAAHAQAFPASDDAAWASAPRLPLQSWGSTASEDL
ncbi:GNAT family N-acetyltransferase [Kitasatospora sp. DSM 101779]|uniref:GNAT family N-acetyltransferase n=1 Tax=Kitasatospora sp. DSM 101779 TaxID=2853165 RepID=UPI0021D8270B|nr:GNAT family N-acetyltransferase [Kitasatospora sp. DSM 101779]MCU7827333.1 GNAT family N-acetyltransferase [Kitasatospora sp. DSM 101779]